MKCILLLLNIMVWLRGNYLTNQWPDISNKTISMQMFLSRDIVGYYQKYLPIDSNWAVWHSTPLSGCFTYLISNSNSSATGRYQNSWRDFHYDRGNNSDSTSRILSQTGVSSSVRPSCVFHNQTWTAGDADRATKRRQVRLCKNWPTESLAQFSSGCDIRRFSACTCVPQAKGYFKGGPLGPPDSEWSDTRSGAPTQQSNLG